MESQLTDKPHPDLRVATSNDCAANSESALTAPLLSMRGISKEFPGVRALDDVAFELRAGEVHVLFGENGAGKSTLINILSGALPLDQGTIEFQGTVVRYHSVHDARLLGIAAVFQEFSLAPDLSVEDNLFLGAEPTKGFFLHKSVIHKRAHEVLTRLGFSIDPKAVVSRLSRAEQQMVEIAKAILTDPKILVLDEPTASLTERETAQLFRLVKYLTNSGVGVIYITHRIAEIQEIGDRVTVLRDGRYIATVPADGVNQQQLVELMTGRTVGEFFPSIDHRPGKRMLELRNLTTTDNRVRDVSIELFAGEIVGLAGLVGCGKSEIGRACFGLTDISRGEVEFLGNIVAKPTPRSMLQSGLYYLPPDRRREGLMLERSTRENISLPALDLSLISCAGVLRRANERRFTRHLAERVHVKPLRMDGQVAQYSGGNQQKVMLAKGLTRPTQVFIFDEPTVGIDVGAKIEIYRFLKDLVDSGSGVVLISSELPEILHLCHRVYIIHDGLVKAHLTGAEITEENALAHFFDGETVRSEIRS